MTTNPNLERSVPQMLDLPARYPPEHRLWFSVLFTGLRAAALFIHNPKTRPWYATEADVDWVYIPNHDIGGLDWVCNALGLCPDTVRRRFRDPDYQDRLIKIGLRINAAGRYAYKPGSKRGGRPRKKQCFQMKNKG